MSQFPTFSAVATSNGMIGLNPGCTIAGQPINSPTTVLDPQLGQCAFFPAGSFSSFDWNQNENLPSSTGTIVTHAAILRQSATNNGFSPITTIRTGDTGMWITQNGTNTLQVGSNAGATPFVDSGLTMAFGRTYFCIASYNLTNTNFLLLDMMTGAIMTRTGQGPPTLGSFTFPAARIGNYANQNAPCNCPVAAAAIGQGYLTLQQMLAWAQDPWSFWYPQKFDLLQAVGKAASGSAFTISAVEGVYTLTGKTQSLNVARTISTVQGTYTQTGEAQAFTRGKGLSVSQGNYTLTGEAQTLNRGININPVQGAYSVTGETQGLGVGLPAAQGTYTLTGEPQKFPIALSSKEAQGSYGVTGFPQVLTNTKFGQTSTPQGGKFIADVGNMTERNY